MHEGIYKQHHGIVFPTDYKSFYLPCCVQDISPLVNLGIFWFTLAESHQNVSFGFVIIIHPSIMFSTFVFLVIYGMRSNGCTEARRLDYKLNMSNAVCSGGHKTANRKQEHELKGIHLIL